MSISIRQHLDALAEQRAVNRSHQGGDRMSATPYPDLCICVACGPPWRDVTPRPNADTAVTLAGLSWASWMALCPACGSKRCPGAKDHANPCAEPKGDALAVQIRDERCFTEVPF